MADFPTIFLASGRVGFYLRVLEAGEVGAGDPIERLAIGEGRMTVREVIRLRYFDPGNLEGAREALHVPALPPRWRSVFTERMAKAGSTVESSPPRPED